MQAMSASQLPILTIAGSDSSAGAGIQADLKTMAAQGCYGLSAVTAVVSETPGRVSRLSLVDPDLIEDQIRVLFEGFPIVAAKTGMVGGAEQVRTVAAAWRQHGAGLPLVVDPVMVATGGGKLLEDEAVIALIELLPPLATLLTPNMDEAAVLWGREVADREAMAACAQDLAARFGTAVLVKGGHLGGDSADDVLCHAQGLEWFEGRRVHGVQTHGTGCSYSAAIACGLGAGLALSEAVSRAKSFIARAISEHFEWKSTAGGVIHALNHLG